MAFKKSFRSTANKFKENVVNNDGTLVEQLIRFECQTNCCELLLESKLVERFFQDSQMNNLQLINRFFRLLCRSFKQSRTNAIKLFLRLPNSKLFDYVYDYLKPSNAEDKDLIEQFISNTTKVLQILIEIHPHCYNQLDSKGIFDRLEKYSQQTTNADVQTEIVTLISEIDNFRDNAKKKEKKTIEFEIDRDDPPPDDFHQLSVYPSLNDIFQLSEPYLRKNITSGQYTNGTQYLDIHFRLLREDFLGPLREAICQFMSEDNRETAFRNANVRLYRNVVLTGCNCSTVGILFCLNLDQNSLPKSLNWANSRRLIYGNLLAATFDNFASSCFLLTVEDRSNIDKTGTIFVRCQKELCDYKLMRIPPGTSFTLLETTSYFEAYRPILQALQNIKDDRIPLDNYLLNCEKDVQLPKYFQENTDIDFRPILVKDLGIINQYHGKLSNVTDLSTWPNAEQLGLDDSQYKAFQLAITKSVALIQGPPGCGKTFLGVRLTELFYHNRERIIGCQRPILMICYTNHALDQFLSSIIKKLSLQPGEIVRVGGRSTHADIEPFLIQKLRQDKRRDLRSKSEELSKRYEILSSIRKQIDDCNAKYYRCCQQLLDGSQLATIMERSQFLSFIEPILHDLDIYKKHWRSNSGGVYCCRLVETSDSDGSDDDDEETDEEEDDLSDYELAQRMRNRIHCRQLNDLSDHDKKEIQQLLLKWLNTNDLNMLMREIIQLQERDNDVDDDGEGEFQVKKKRNKKLKEKATAVLKEIFNEVPQTTVTDTQSVNDENIVPLDEDEEEQRRLENIDNSYIPFNPSNSNENITKSLDIEQLEYMQRLMNNRTALISDEQAETYQDLWSNSISRENRQDLYRYWLSKYAHLLADEWFCLNEQYDENHRSMQELWLNNDLNYMQNAFIIAMTTHCASRYQKILKQVAPQICIVEEAAEVFESHIITAIGENCEHLVLIGDHVQLRPSTNVYTLAKKYQLDVSLFERLIKNNMPSIQLSVQHRSIPMISHLTHHFYDIPIENHESVLNRSSIIGVSHPLYFITHSNPEENVADGTSKRNSHECTYILQLANYLLNQGYDKSEITILTTYMGQRQQFQKMINQTWKQLKGIHVTVVDNFQGEENRIILLSLVRSNADKRLGYVAVDNRICVALSRARDGLYVVGNFHLFVEENATWKIIVDKIKETNLIGKGLPIMCPNHTDNQLICTNPNDFLKRPLGGCGLKCEFRLSCGHQCPSTCHISSHNSIICHKRCLKTYDDCEHQCQRVCHSPNECPPCNATVVLKMPNCEHTSDIPCVMRKTNKLECAVRVPYTCPNGHQVQVRCSDLRNKELQDQLCSQPCDAILECGHKCKGTCSKCLQGRFHWPCNERELIIYTCGHSQDQRCHEIGSRCTQEYFKLCAHGDTPKISSNLNLCEIYQCNRYCLNRCKHRRCDQRCKLECNSQSCKEKCSKRFDCDHYCNGVCGEPCIRCLICRERELPNDIRTELRKNVRHSTFVQLECDHLFSTMILDEYVDNFQNKIFHPSGFMYVDYPRCPHCQASMVQCKRYSSLIKKIQSRLGTVDRIQETQTDAIKSSFISLKAATLPIDIDLPDKITEIIQTKCDLKRQSKLIELFVHVIGLFIKLSSNVSDERDRLLKSVYKFVEENQTIFLTKQQWLDLESEYNRLILIERFHSMKDLDANDESIDTLDDILFGPNPFTEFACKICYLLFGETDDDKWKSILLENKTWKDFEQDRFLCDEKWVVCPEGKHLIWLQDALTPESICVGCLNIRKTLVSSLRQPIAQGYGRGRFPRNNRPDFTSTRSTK